MYNNLLYDFHELEQKYLHDTTTLNLLKSLHNKMLMDYPREEIIEELFYVLKNMSTYEDGWNNAVDEYKIYDDLKYL